MGGWIIQHEGESYTLPFDFDRPDPVLGRFPDGIVLTMDESKFEASFGKHAIWTHGKGPFAVLAYCGGELTITRWSNLDEAVRAKRTIDDTGCGGRCTRVHVIVQFLADNRIEAARKAAVGKYIAEHGLKPRSGICAMN